jgi:hypothetical protein
MKYWRVIYTPLFFVCLKICKIAEVTGCNPGITVWNPDRGGVFFKKAKKAKKFTDTPAAALSAEGRL